MSGVVRKSDKLDIIRAQSVLAGLPNMNRFFDQINTVWKKGILKIFLSFYKTGVMIIFFNGEIGLG